MNTEKPIYTIGHRNPDTDSICSAIGYAYFKQQQGENVIAARAGKINEETKFALEKFGMAAPQLIVDLYPRVKDIALESDVVVKDTDSLRVLGEIFREKNVKSVPVINAEKKLCGIVTVSDLAKRYFNELNMQNLADSNVTLADVCNVLDGQVVSDNDKALTAEVNGHVRIAAGSAKTISRVIAKSDIVLMGDRDAAAMYACLEQNIAALIVTGAAEVYGEVLSASEAKGIVVISTPFDTYTAARLVNQCLPVSKIMQTNVTTFKPSDLVEDIKVIMEQTQFRNYPVVENDKLVGLVNRDNLIVPAKEKIILVDHNERGQAVEGLEAAKVIEIIDHHRLGGIQTSEPIFTHQEPVGSTATIVAKMCWQRNVAITPAIAGLLLSAVISDTVLFKSPTCTQHDRNTAERLAEIAGVDINEYGMAMLKAGSGIGNMSPQEIAKNDMKEFQFGDYHIVIGQLSVMDTAEVMAIKDKLVKSMQDVCKNEGYDMSLLMVTDILTEGTELLFTPEGPVSLLAKAFNQTDLKGRNVISLPGVMSRKKQIVPPLTEAAQS